MWEGAIQRGKKKTRRESRAQPRSIGSDRGCRAECRKKEQGDQLVVVVRRRKSDKVRVPSRGQAGDGKILISTSNFMKAAGPIKRASSPDPCWNSQVSLLFWAGQFCSIEREGSRSNPGVASDFLVR